MDENRRTMRRVVRLERGARSAPERAPMALRDTSINENRRLRCFVSRFFFETAEERGFQDRGGRFSRERFLRCPGPEGRLRGESSTTMRPRRNRPLPRPAAASLAALNPFPCPRGGCPQR